MSIFLRGKIWWYEFYFDGRLESSGQPRHTRRPSQNRPRRTADETWSKDFNGISDDRPNRVQSLEQVARDYLQEYKLRHTGRSTPPVSSRTSPAPGFGCDVASETADRIENLFVRGRLPHFAATIAQAALTDLPSGANLRRFVGGKGDAMKVCVGIVFALALPLSAATVTTPVEGDAPIFGYPSVSLAGDGVSISMGAGRVSPIFGPTCGFDRPLPDLGHEWRGK